ncbi:MAG: hypothetical protein KA242_02995 [Chitinophagales bacterium]|jgi:hypothetical protein|nr:hypothetical protein [Chitinophagales bacterium]
MNTTPKKSAEEFTITGNWTSLSKQFKVKFPHLSDADLKFVPGEEKDLLTRLTTKLHKTNEELVTLIQKFEADKK